MSECRFYNEVMDAYPVLTREEERELFIQLEQGDKNAREKIILSNIRLVINIAKDYLCFNNLGMADLGEWGIFGLMSALERFDYTRGYKFSTYATFWIKTYIRTAVMNEMYPVKVSRDTYLLLKKVVPENKRLSLQDIAKTLNVKKFTALALVKASKSPVSLSSPIDGGGILDEVIADGNNFPIEEAINQYFLKEVLEELFNKVLDDREKEILKYRNGFYGEPMFLKKVGKKFNISRESVRQIQKSAIKKLRRYCEGNPKYLYAWQKYQETRS